MFQQSALRKFLEIYSKKIQFDLISNIINRIVISISTQNPDWKWLKIRDEATKEAEKYFSKKSLWRGITSEIIKREVDMALFALRGVVPSPRFERAALAVRRLAEDKKHGT